VQQQTFSPAVLIIDDDISITSYLRERFHKETSVGVLVANKLSEARTLLDSKSVEIDAVIADLHFETEYEDTEYGLLNGIDILRYAQQRRPEINQYVFSIWVERAREREEAKRFGLNIKSWMHKMFYDPKEKIRTPWGHVERDLIKERLQKDPEVKKRAKGLGLDHPDALEGVSEYARALNLPVRTYIQELPDKEYLLKEPIEVICVRDKSGVVSARASRIGLLTEGIGESVEEALKQLSITIMDQKESLDKEPEDFLLGYGKVLNERLDSYIGKRRQEKKRPVQLSPRSGKKGRVPSDSCSPMTSGDLQNPVIASVARGLGLREPDLNAAVGYDLGRDCLLLCRATTLLMKCQDDPVAFKPSAYLPMVDLFVKEAAECLDTTKKWNNAENKALTRHRQTLELLKNDYIVMPLAIRVIGMIDRKR